MTSPRSKREIIYPDSCGYDCEGYGLTAGIHKYDGIRRCYRDGIYEKLAITDAEQALIDAEKSANAMQSAREQTCFMRRPATDDRPWGGHRLRAIDHDEQQCADCGVIFCCPDVD
jgi:hypothetical protein